MGDARKHPFRILVVDDDRSLRNICAETLSRAGYAADTAIHGFEAMEKIRASGYDLIVSDIHMPVLDGLGLYRSVAVEFPDLRDRFLFMTGSSPSASREIKEYGLKVIKKPFSISDLLSGVEKIFAEKKLGVEICRRHEGRQSWSGDCLVTESTGKGLPFSSRALDISKNGLRIRYYAGNPLKPGSTIKINVWQLELSRTATAVWSDALGHAECLTGLRFDMPISDERLPSFGT